MKDAAIQIVDVDQPQAWPAPIEEWVRRRADALAGSTEYTSDLDYRLEEQEADLRMLLRGYTLVAYHCTRLLKHELEWIRKRGLVPLTAALVAQRIDAAHAVGHIDSAQRELLLANSAFAIDGGRGRRGHVCLSLGRRELAERHGGCETLLETWGGEAIYMGLEDDQREALRQIGTPTVVVARIEPSADVAAVRTHPALPKVFVGAMLGLHDVGADVLHRPTIAPEAIIDIWQPGHPNYDRHRWLPGARSR